MLQLAHNLTEDYKGSSVFVWHTLRAASENELKEAKKECRRRGFVIEYDGDRVLVGVPIWHMDEVKEINMSNQKALATLPNGVTVVEGDNPPPPVQEYRPIPPKRDGKSFREMNNKERRAWVEAHRAELMNDFAEGMIYTKFKEKYDIPYGGLVSAIKKQLGLKLAPGYKKRQHSKKPAVEVPPEVETPEPESIKPIPDWKREYLTALRGVVEAVSEKVRDGYTGVTAIDQFCKLLKCVDELVARVTVEN